MNWRLLLLVHVAALGVMGGGVLSAMAIGSPSVGWLIGWASAIVVLGTDKKLTKYLRDNDRRPEGRDVKQARGASPPEWAEGIAQTEASE